MERKHDLFAVCSRYRGVIMGLCAVIILFFHSWVVTFREFPVLGAVEGALKRYGYYCVDVFLLVSGFGMAYALKPGRTIKNFYAKRARRVFVPYVELVLLDTLIHAKPVQEIILRISGISLFIHGVDTPLWFVPALLMMYLAYPWLQKRLESARNETCRILLWIACLILVASVLQPVIPGRYYGVLYRSIPFLTGILLGRMSLKKRILISKRRMIACAAAAVVLMVLCDAAREILGFRMLKGVYTTLYALAFVLFVSWLCLLIDEWKALPARIGRYLMRILQFCGLFTLEMYGLQEVLYWKIAEPLDARLTYLQTNIAGMLIMIAVSYLMHEINRRIWTYVERKS